MSVLSIALAILIQHEGGYVDHRADPGGATKYGISLRFLKKQQAIKGDIDDDGDIDADDIKKLTPDDVYKIYAKEFWDEYDLDEIADQKIANILFGMLVNIGPHNAIKLIKKSANQVLKENILEADGALTPHSIQVINGVDRDKLLFKYKWELSKYYNDLVDRNPKLDVFLNGWLRRLNTY